MRLRRAGDLPVPFVCAMSDSTPPHFDCTPRHGTLQPRNPPGQSQPAPPIMVTFTCKDFGRAARGTMFVYAGEEQYTFDVVGRQPQYTAPVAAKSRLDNRLAPSIQAGWKAKQAAGRGKKALKTTW